MLDIDPAEYIARNWYIGMSLIYVGVDFGKCMEYDVLQIVNRGVVSKREENERQSELQQSTVGILGEVSTEQE